MVTQALVNVLMVDVQPLVIPARLGISVACKQLRLILEQIQVRHNAWSMDDRVQVYSGSLNGKISLNPNRHECSLTVYATTLQERSNGKFSQALTNDVKAHANEILGVAKLRAFYKGLFLYNRKAFEIYHEFIL